MPPKFPNFTMFNCTSFQKFNPIVEHAAYVLNSSISDVFSRFNTNDEGESRGVIDAEEEKRAIANSSVYFVEKGMDFNTFCKKNQSIFFAEQQQACKDIEMPGTRYNICSTPNTMLTKNTIEGFNKITSVNYDKNQTNR